LDFSLKSIVTTVRNPALERFLAQIGKELVLAQVLIGRLERGFELRHVEDRARPAETLRAVPLDDLRSLAQFTAAGAFRPLKAAPNLQRGWRTVVTTDEQLETALHHLYPGAIADWFAAQAASPPVTSYREFTNRQTGMYRITQMLSDAQASAVIRACCHKDFCLKRRLWTVAGLAPDEAGPKSLIPCLEPCAVLLEFARTAMRVEQQQKQELALAPDELASMRFALETALTDPEGDLREADFSAPANPRRLRWLLEKLGPPDAVESRSRVPPDPEPGDPD
jgi:hypothetical protein